jgi:hypothetical protein
LKHKAHYQTVTDAEETPMPDASLDDCKTADHEAGHAVGAVLLGVPFDEVSLDRVDRGKGCVPGTLTIKQIRESNLSWQNAVVAMLGPETERLIHGRADPEACDGDEEVIERLYRTFFDSEMSEDQYDTELRSRTAEVLERPGFLEAVRAVARILLEKRVVLAWEVEEAVKAAGLRS